MPELEPIVAGLGLSPEQAEAAAARGCAVAVTAGAGAGKTRTLVARYLSLLAEGVPPRRVVAITFTRKAAREMRNRAREEVRRYLADAALDEGERRRWQVVYAQLDAARIGTIHSLCGEILRHHPAETGLDPRFEVLEEGQAALLQADAVEAALAWAADDPEGAELYTLFGEQPLARAVSQLLAGRLDASEAFAALPEDPEALRAYWEAAVASARRQAIEALFEDASFREAVALLRGAAPQTEADKLVAQVREALGAIDAALEAMRATAKADPCEHAPTQPPPEGEGSQLSLHWGEGNDEARFDERGPVRPGTAEQERAAQALAVLGEIRLNVGSQRAWPGGKEELAEVKDAMRALREAWREAEAWASLSLTAVDENLIRCYPALRDLYHHASVRYRELKRRQAALDFDDLEAGALDLLHRHLAIRTYWQEEVAALLVDEFQDTNARQRDLLDLLDVRNEKLFLVGDGKQSIYRFRGADVTVFRQKRAQVADEGQAHDLAISYRAHAGLTEALNALLAPVLGRADASRPYVEPFARLVHHRDLPAEGLASALRSLRQAAAGDEPRRYEADGAAEEGTGPTTEGAVQGKGAAEVQDIEGESAARQAAANDKAAQGQAAAYVEVHLALGSKREGALERAAEALVARLVDLVACGKVQVSQTDPDEGGTVIRSLDYGDIAILCRASGAFPAYEDALESAGVPFLTVAGRGFYDRPEVRDVLNALQAIADPTDDLALGGLLRSASCRLTDMALYRLVEARRRQEVPSLWALLEHGDLSSLEDEAEPARQASEWIRRLHEQVGRVPVADVLAGYLEQTDYRAALLQAGQGRAARNVAKLLSDAHRSQIVGAPAFLEYVAQLRDVGAREGEAYSVGGGAVQVMTVHAAKGLEFPVVVIGDASRQEPRTRGLLVDPVLGVLPELKDQAIDARVPGETTVETVRSAVYQLAQRSAQDQEQAESDRLLYVAATRARELLLISAAVGSRGLDGWLARLDHGLPLSEWLAEGAGTEPAVRSAMLEAGAAPVRCTLYPEDLAPLDAHAAAFAPSALILPEDLPLLRSLVPEPIVADEEASAAQRDPPRRVWRIVPEEERPWAPSWAVGQLVHRALEQWAFPGPGSGFGVRAKGEAQRCGITDEAEIEDAVRRAARMLTRFKGTELYKKMDAAPVRWHEVPYSRLDEQGCLEQGVIDALYQDEAGWVLVEFKTDWIEDDADLIERLATADYVPQVGRYLDAVEAQLAVRPRPALCLLNYNRTVRVIEDRW
jgi:ATP-dependent helicase/nuclease subunit A